MPPITHQQWLGPNSDTKWTILFKEACSSGTCTKCLDLAGGNIANGTPIQVWGCNSKQSQQWVFEGGKVKFLQDKSKCIDVPGGSMTDGTKLQIVRVLPYSPRTN